ncbi:hypothetical protein TVAG_049190 [Trichomonas vaginalis G3]|uniref:Anaphase-promoting complex subunit 4-like WD40 domain-containing protein n=1 Tax=Trichomonas vaginalis (strain ATCC PRA-98 / G3) TaxID=412133 RepID=A2FJR8_TRIV3|nr:WD repeat-containing protein family [Trichomonas vaginalis G3]EAX94850.1 hypothetical protein TVAG_049190 [Trichomonas vaginalis G3]KAI5485707.1 WD repeat-containing protein family [Trichomonas vaginalis G3]|eukprot:XP_001307780.1 hypothetical protein [Trichomonas vaginalis G3]
MKTTITSDLGPSKATIQAEKMLEQVENFVAAISKLQQEVERLQGMKDLAQIHLNQYKKDYELLHNAYKNANTFVNQIDNSSPNFSLINPKKPDSDKADSTKNGGSPAEPTILTPYPQYQNCITLDFNYQHDSKITCLAISNSGEFLAFIASENVLLIDIPEKVVVKTFPLPQDEPIRGDSRCIAFSRDDQMIAVSYNDNYIAIFDANTGDVKKKLRMHTKDVSSLLFTRDGKYMISSGQDGYIYSYSYPNFEVISSLSNQIDSKKPHPITGVCEDNDGKTLYISYVIGAISIVEYPSLVSKMIFQTHSDKLMGIYLDKNEGLIATLMNTAIKIIRITDNIDPMNSLQGHQKVIISGTFAPNDPIFISGSKDESIIMWDYKNKQNPKIAEIKYHQNTVFAVAHSPSAHEFATCDANGLVCYWKYDFPGNQVPMI